MEIDANAIIERLKGEVGHLSVEIVKRDVLIEAYQQRLAELSPKDGPTPLKAKDQQRA